MRILLFTLILLIGFSLSIVETDTKVIDCEIIEVTETFFAISCDPENKIIMEFSKSNWPKEWNDSSKVGDIVKIKLEKDNMLPIKSCAARKKEMEEKYNKRGSGQLQKPLQLPIDKDCQSK